MTHTETVNAGESGTKAPVRILHLEDNVRDQMLLESTIAAAGLVCEFTHVTNRPEFEKALQRASFDLIISDFSLPSYDGMAALAYARVHHAKTPFLFVSGTIGEERAVESLKSGATDYVLKDHLGRLVPAIKRALGETREREERRKLEEQLRQAQKMEAIGQLAGGVAHDFNNLLTVICGNVELVLLRKEPVSDESRECLKQVIAASQRATHLTRQLLAFGRKQVMQAEPLDLNEAIGNLSKMLRRVIGTDIGIEFTYAATRPFVRADVGMMEQVLVNLVVNARDAMPDGGRLLITTERVTVDEEHVRTHPEARAGEFICWAVSDTGTGIPAEHLPHIFEPFYTTKAPGKGTGLGLATIHGIVKQHDGWIEVQTRPGAGTTFEIFLPAIPTPSTVTSPDGGTSTLRGGNERILLAENEPSVRMLTRRLLETFGYEVLEATSGREALEVAASGARIDLLMTGFVMPDGITGPELATQLGKKFPGSKVIFVSGHDREVGRGGTEFLQKGTGCFLQKPCASQLLITTVRRCLDEGCLEGSCRGGECADSVPK